MDKCLGRQGIENNIEKTKMIVRDTEGETALSQIDPYGICGKRLKSNAVCLLHAV